MQDECFSLSRARVVSGVCNVQVTVKTCLLLVALPGMLSNGQDSADPTSQSTYYTVTIRCTQRNREGARKIIILYSFSSNLSPEISTHKYSLVNTNYRKYGAPCQECAEALFTQKVTIYFEESLRKLNTDVNYLLSEAVIIHSKYIGSKNKYCMLLTNKIKIVRKIKHQVR